MAIPRSSAENYRRQQSIIVRLLLALRRVWRRMDPKGNWSEQYEEDGIGAQLVMLISAAQVAAVTETDGYMWAVLDELGLTPGGETAEPTLRPAAFAGVTGAGLPVGDVLGLAVARAGQSYNTARAEAGGHMAEAYRTFDREAAAVDALADAERFIDNLAATIIADTARAAEEAATASREWVDGWVRMVNPPCCSRCAVLAGRFYLWNDGFERHPGCDCRHIPASEAIAGDVTLNPDAYFESLSREDQDRIFTKSGAEAIRHGADIDQVVNARRGMTKAQSGRLVRNADGLFTTTEGTTRRGSGNARRNGRRSEVRLMPESIFELADGDRSEAIRLLRLHGFLA